jgi:hypothetical protein
VRAVVTIELARTPEDVFAGLLPGFASGIMARRAEKQFRNDFERLKKRLES